MADTAPQCKCGHPAVVHGGIARPGTDECAYRRCDCTEYEPADDQ